MDAMILTFERDEHIQRNIKTVNGSALVGIEAVENGPESGCLNFDL